MNVLLTNHFPLEGSGSGIYTQNIARFLVKKGINVTVICPDVMHVAENKFPFKVRTLLFKHPDKSGQKQYDVDFNFPCFTTHPESVNTFYNLNDTQIQEYCDKFYNLIKQSIKEDNIDLFHGQHIWTLSYLGFKAGLKGIITCHGTDLMGLKKDERYKQHAVEAVKNCSKIIAISDEIETQILNNFDVKKNKIVKVLNGFNPDVFRPHNITRKEVFQKLNLPETDYLISFVGKLAHFKGVDILLDAAADYEKQLNVTTIIMGDGELRKKLEKQKKELNLKNVYFLGQKPQNEIAEIISGADVSVVPSRKEPFGLVAIEALACETPAVVSDDGGLAEFINDKVGNVFRSEDSQDLSDKLVYELKNNSKQKKGKYAAEYALNNFSWDSVVDNVIKIYNEVE
jgi:glycosyltransferase involved in cell wall biosynthesis